MSGFLLINRNSKCFSKLNNGLKAFEKKSYKLELQVVELGNFSLYSYKEKSRYNLESYNPESENYFGYYGYLVYKEKTGTEALEEIERQLNIGIVLEDMEFIGNFFLVVYYQSNLMVTRDLFGGFGCYTNSEKSWFTSNFAASIKLVDVFKLNRQEVIETVFFDFEIGYKTKVNNVFILPPSRVFYLRDKSEKRKKIKIPPMISDLTASLEQNLSTLRDEFGLYKRFFGNNVTSALSGGFDSRLMLAGLLDSGIKPNLYVYGNDKNKDVVVAKDVCSHEGILLNHINKSRSSPKSIDEIAQIVRQNYWDFDGGNNLFLDSNELTSRMDRSNNNNIVLNGSGGEIYRDIWKYDFKKKSIFDLFLNSYNTGELEIFGIKTDDFFEEIEVKIKEQVKDFINIGDGITRQEAEYVFLIYRSNFYYKSNTINNNFGIATLPFLSQKIGLTSFNIPYYFKRSGKFSASLIKSLNPKIAKYNSEHGFNFFDGPDKLSIMKEWAYSQLNPNLKSKVKRLTGTSNKSVFKKSDRNNSFINEEVKKELFGDNKLILNEYLTNIEKVDNPNTKNRILSIELVNYLNS